MSLLNKIFGTGSPKVECPRCLGKGHVSLDDIKRLRKELKWRPGSCAYCNGTGKVRVKQLETIPVDTTYLITDITAEEARKVRHGNKEALERAKQFDIAIDDIVKQIRQFYFIDKWDVNQIANYYFSIYPNAYPTDDAKNELIDYIKGVISSPKSNW